MAGTQSVSIKIPKDGNLYEELKQYRLLKKEGTKEMPWAKALLDLLKSYQEGAGGEEVLKVVLELRKAEDHIETLKEYINGLDEELDLARDDLGLVGAREEKIKALEITCSKLKEELDLADIRENILRTNNIVYAEGLEELEQMKALNSALKLENRELRHRMNSLSDEIITNMELKVEGLNSQLDSSTLLIGEIFKETLGPL